MSDHVRVPTKSHDKRDWGMLSYMTTSHVDVVAESVKEIDAAYTFVGGHRVRRLRLKKNIAFQVPEGVQLDISGVAPAAVPRRPSR